MGFVVVEEEDMSGVMIVVFGYVFGLIFVLVDFGVLGELLFCIIDVFGDLVIGYEIVYDK